MWNLPERFRRDASVWAVGRVYSTRGMICYDNGLRCREYGVFESCLKRWRNNGKARLIHAQLSYMAVK